MPTLGEKWLDVVGFEGRYQVSNQGRIKSLARVILRHPVGRKAYTRAEPERIRKLIPSPKGYLTVMLQSEEGHQTFQVHRLVLEAFIGPCPAGMQCRHFPDRNPANNRIENLSWGTPLDNSDDKVIHGTNNGWTLSEETRQKSAASRTGMKRSVESIAKTAAGLRGRKLSDAHRAKLSEAHKGQKPSAETLAKRSIALKEAWARRKSKSLKERDECSDS